MSDKEMKDKLERLDTLAGGIVFGRDEAWDRLQGKLDKRKRRRALWYQLPVAAAVLLLMATLALHYPHTLTKDKAQIVHLQPAMQVVPDSAVPEVAIVTPVAVNPPTETLAVNIKAEWEPPAIVTITTVAPVLPVPEDSQFAVVDEEVPVDERTVMPTTLSQLPVVHINDLERGVIPETRSITASKEPRLNLSSMRVVSLYDVQREEMMRQREEEIMTIVRINRPHDGIFGLSYITDRSDRNPTRLYSRNPFSIRLNRTN